MVAQGEESRHWSACPSWGYRVKLAAQKRGGQPPVLYPCAESKATERDELSDQLGVGPVLARAKEAESGGYNADCDRGSQRAQGVKCAGAQVIVYPAV